MVAVELHLIAVRGGSFTMKRTHQADALGRENYLKSGAGRRFLKAQLRHFLAEGPPGEPRRRAVA